MLSFAYICSEDLDTKHNASGSCDEVLKKASSIQTYLVAKSLQVFLHLYLRNANITSGQTSGQTNFRAVLIFQLEYDVINAWKILRLKIC